VLEVPEVVRNAAANVGATHWLADLPDLVSALAGEWDLAIGATFPHATEAFVAEVTQADGTPAVLKLLVPHGVDAPEREITVLRLANGDGCVRLLRSDSARGAMLLERLGPSLFDLQRPFPERIEILCATAARVWRPAPDAGLPTGAEKGRWLIDFITRLWDELDRPCTERAVDYALQCAARRISAHDDERAVLVHGDVHQWNVLQSADGYRLVDPDGLLAEAEYDLGIVMREDPEEMLDGDEDVRARWLATRTGLDADAIVEWGAVERVSTGLLGTRDGLQPIAGEMLAVADLVSRRWRA
jgi:streptomycin 6-kinase